MKTFGHPSKTTFTLQIVSQLEQLVDVVDQCDLLSFYGSPCMENLK